MTDKKIAILLNGPPNSGKDLSAVIIRNFLTGKFSNKNFFYRPEILKFADPIKAAVHALYAIPHSCEYYEKEFGNAWKDEPQQECFGSTPRSEYIALAEDFARARHGRDVFARIATRRIHLSKTGSTFIFPDCGFPEEVDTIINFLGIDNILLVELSRPGCSYSGDSRNYVSLSVLPRYPKLKYMKINNNQNQQILTIMLKGMMAKFFDYEAEF